MASRPPAPRQERAAYPLMDGRVVIGALVLLGGQTSSTPKVRSPSAFAGSFAELGPRLGAAKRSTTRSGARSWIR